MCTILSIAMFVIWVNYVDGITINWNCIMLVILFWEKIDIYQKILARV